MFISKTNVGAVSLALLLQGCSLAPDYYVPDIPMPEAWKESSAYSDEEGMQCDHWWEVFNDDLLNELETKAMYGNRELEGNIEKFFQARAMAGVKESDLYPHLKLSPEYDSIGFLYKIFGLSVLGPQAAALSPLVRVHQLIYALPLNLNYEVDLWGKLRNDYKSAELKAEAQNYAAQAAALMISADLAADYFQLRALDAQLELLAKTIDVRKDFLDIVAERYRAGFVTFIDQSRAETLVYDAETSYYNVLRERVLLVNAIAVLVGEPPSIFDLAPMPLDNPPPVIPAGIPSTILLRRPDINELERRAAAENASIGVAYASLLPTLSLTGALGFVSPDTEDFLKWRSRYWAMGASSEQPIFDGFRRSNEIEMAWSRFGQASSNYQQSVLKALKEVEDSLSNIRLETLEMDKLEQSIETTQLTTELALTRYKHGQIDYLDVSNSERENLEVKRRAAEMLGRQYVATIQLIKALGGSW